MKNSISSWDALFGKKVRIEIPDGKGGVIVKYVSEKLLEKLENENKIKKLDYVKVNILDPIKGFYQEDWIIGKDIDVDMFEKYKDDITGELYVINVYESGQLKVGIFKKEIWDQAKKQYEYI